MICYWKNERGNCNITVFRAWCRHWRKKQHYLNTEISANLNCFTVLRIFLPLGPLGFLLLPINHLTTNLVVINLCHKAHKALAFLSRPQRFAARALTVAHDCHPAVRSSSSTILLHACCFRSTWSSPPPWQKKNSRALLGQLFQSLTWVSEWVTIYLNSEFHQFTIGFYESRVRFEILNRVQ